MRHRPVISPIFKDQSPTKMDFLPPLQMGTTGCPKMSVINYQPTPYIIFPAKQRPQDKITLKKKPKKKLFKKFPEVM